MQNENSLIVRRVNYFGLLFAFFMMSFIALTTTHAKAHEIRPSIADFELLSDEEFQIKILTNAEALISEIGAEHDETDESPNSEKYNALRNLSATDLAKAFEGFKGQFLNSVLVKFDGEQANSLSVRFEPAETGDVDLPRDSYVYLQGPVPPGATHFSWKWSEAYGPSVIRINEFGRALGDGYSAYLSNGAESEAIALKNARPAGFWKTACDYLVIGFTHILPKGLDHILFVVGLFLLSIKLKPLIWQITAFTLAHTVTLALGILGYVSISPSIVEPLIAASIVYVAVENMMISQLSKWRPIIVFCFGLLHGLGFAGVLGEIGLSSNQFVTGLIAFNIGVELGQLAVIALCFLAVGIWFGNKPWYRRFITIPASIVIALIACWWVYERVFLT